jgi:hypothetical protein
MANKIDPIVSTGRGTSSEYHLAAAARARRLLSEATIPWVKQQLADAIARHEELPTEFEAASVPDIAEVLAESETPGGRR